MPSDSTGISVSITSAQTPIARLHLRWSGKVAPGLLILGDHWERAYGDLEWRGLIPERVLPWYFLTHDGTRTHGYGVRTGPAAFAFWRIDPEGVSLWLDLRNGGGPAHLGARTVTLCTVVSRAGQAEETPWQAARSFCQQLCSNSRLPKEPVFGFNNWYYSYGENCSAEAVLRDATVLADLAPAGRPRPFQVIDDGWQAESENAWACGNVGFPDMPGLASKLRALDVRPGIWIRPLLTLAADAKPLSLRAAAITAQAGLILDPTIAEARAQIRANIARLVGWGFELIKHDFTTFDLLGRWGREMGAHPARGDWHFHDRSRTNAEIVRDLYALIRDAAGESTLLVGCNTVGHLAAGLFEVQRTGDDTSGKKWDTTRRMGVNTLAFRGPQHGVFFAADADCVGMTPAVPWEMNRQWLDLVARSGTPLFVSAAPNVLGPDERAALRVAFAHAANPSAMTEPVDWLETTSPGRWQVGNHVEEYRWVGDSGIVQVD